MLRPPLVAAGRGHRDLATPRRLIAGGLVARRLGWPLILDYRDPWSAYDWPDWHRGGLTQWIAGRIESRLVRASAARVLNTPNMREWFEECFTTAPTPGNYVVPNGFDAMPAREPPSREGPLRIVHAPNHPYFKGTRHLVAAVERLQSEGAGVELHMLSGVSNARVLELIRSADVVADQFIGGSYGYFAVEAMATGKPVGEAGAPGAVPGRQVSGVAIGKGADHRNRGRAAAAARAAARRELRGLRR